MSEILAERFRIGYALAPKKVESVILPCLIDTAKERGIDLIPIDVAKPLTDQAPLALDCILHKLYDDDWKKQLDDISLTNPSLVIIDPPYAIEKLHNRVTMLQVVTLLQIPPQFTQSCGIPKQLVLHDLASDSDPEKLTFPVIAKPLVANGSLSSHKMSLVLNKEGLKRLEVTHPIVLQEFVNHGGLLFKVYVAGKHVQCVKRPSLPDIPDSNSGGLDLPAIISFAQISNLAVAATEEDKNKSDDKLEAEMPASSFVLLIAKGLRQALGLNLFNFDMIRDARDPNRYLVIDINYFPGYAKLPSYEKFLTDFFWDIATAHQKMQKLD